MFAPSQNSAKASQLQSSRPPHFEILHSKYAVPQSVDEFGLDYPRSNLILSQLQ